jgi:hypothetical protein
MAKRHNPIQEFYFDCFQSAKPPRFPPVPAGARIQAVHGLSRGRTLEAVFPQSKGAGATNPTGTDGVVSRAPLPVPPLLPAPATVDNLEAEIQDSGAAPSLFSGVLQVNARVPNGATTGPSVPIILRIGGQSSPLGPMISIRRSDCGLAGPACLPEQACGLPWGNGPPPTGSCNTSEKYWCK